MLKKIFTDKSHNSLIQFFRYAIVGAIASVVDYGLLLSGVEIFHLELIPANTIGFCGGLITNYILSIVWVFPVKMMKKRYLEFIVFGIIGVVGLGLNNLFIWFFTERIGIDYKISKIIAMALVLLWNFSARKFLLFRKGNAEENGPVEG
jgi:putative flippase GtrA